MQVNSPSGQASDLEAAPTGSSAGGLEGSVVREALLRDMYALVSFLLRNSNVGAFDAIAELDLSFTQIKALCAMDLDETEPSLKGLAESMGVSLPAMSRAVDGLYVRGFVDRCEDREDRRIKRIALTESGRAVTATLSGVRMLAGERFLSSLGDEEAQALGRALELVIDARSEISDLRPDHDQITELLARQQQEVAL
jgi:DNA-binding MarR family transcriptional regulator